VHQIILLLRQHNSLKINFEIIIPIVTKRLLLPSLSPNSVNRHRKQIIYVSKNRFSLLNQIKDPKNHFNISDNDMDLVSQKNEPVII